MSATAEFTYSVEDVNGSVKRTNSLLRSLNAVRVIIHDLQEFQREPSIAGAFWIVVQFSRIFNSLKRLNKLLQEESNVSLGFMRGLGQIPVIDMDDFPDLGGGLGPIDMNVTVTAFRENLPMGLEGLDISGLPERSRETLQRVFEEDAAMTVFNARELLMERIKYPERSTGTLENSIGWRTQTDGVQIYADAYYAWWTETGHQTFLGHHFLRDAADRSRERLPLRIKAELDELIKQETSK